MGLQRGAKTFVLLNWDFLIGKCSRYPFPNAETAETELDVVDDPYKIPPAWRYIYYKLPETRGVQVEQAYFDVKKALGVEGREFMELQVAPNADNFQWFVRGQSDMTDSVEIVVFGAHPHDLWFDKVRFSLPNSRTVQIVKRGEKEAVQEKITKLSSTVSVVSEYSKNDLDALLGRDNTHLYLCRRDVQTPPHLDPFFSKLAARAKSRSLHTTLSCTAYQKTRDRLEDRSWRL